MIMRYFRQFRMQAAYTLLCAGIFLGVFALTGLPLRPVLYALGLCAALALPFLFLGYFRFRKRRRLLQSLDPRLPFQELPGPETPLEADYQALVRQLYDARQRQEEEARQKYEEQLDYFTLWAHQIKTPIAGMALILQEEGEMDRGELKNELFHIQQYVSMALHYLRLETPSDFLFQSCELDRIIRNAIRAYAAQLIRQKIRIVYEPVRAQVLTDEKWLQFVVEQLLSNAVKYAPGGTVTITLEPGTVLRIADNGTGIAPEDLPRIFEKGYTGFHGRKNRQTTGIGLYLCRKIMDRLGHTIRAESSVGEGTCFYLDLAKTPLELDR